MGDKTTIEWTDATWNPVRGCSIVSKGCTNCYAMRQAHRHANRGGAYEGLTKLTNGGPVWTGAVRLVPELLGLPLRWRAARRIFVNSMSDLFQEAVPYAFIDQVWGTMAAAPQHVFQILTKRPERMRDYLLDRLRVGGIIAQPLSNVWLGVSAEDQKAADERIPFLLETPAAVRWISAEPLLGPITLERPIVNDDALRERVWLEELGWVVAGGESGPGARPMHPDWARSLRDQCVAADVAFFFKQWGSWAEVASADRDPETGDHRRIEVPSHEAEDAFDPASDCLIAPDGQVFRKLEQIPENVLCRQMTRGQKKWCGRELDGRTHDEYPVESDR